MIFDFFHKNSNQQSTPNKSLEERLNKHPQLKTRVEDLLNIVENTENDIKNANVAEQKVIDQVRQIGQEVLEDWAIQPASRIAEEFQTAHPDLTKPGKKKLHWHTTERKIELKEQLFLQDGLKPRPFSKSASIYCRSYSLPRQKGYN